MFGPLLESLSWCQPLLESLSWFKPGFGTLLESLSWCKPGVRHSPRVTIAVPTPPRVVIVVPAPPRVVIVVPTPPRVAIHGVKIRVPAVVQTRGRKQRVVTRGRPATTVTSWVLIPWFESLACCGRPRPRVVIVVQTGVRLPPRVTIVVQTRGSTSSSSRYRGTNRWMWQYPWCKNTGAGRGTNRGESNVS